MSEVLFLSLVDPGLEWIILILDQVRVIRFAIFTHLNPILQLLRYDFQSHFRHDDQQSVQLDLLTYLLPN